MNEKQVQDGYTPIEEMANAWNERVVSHKFCFVVANGYISLNIYNNTPDVPIKNGSVINKPNVRPYMAGSMFPADAKHTYDSSFLLAFSNMLPSLSDIENSYAQYMANDQPYDALPVEPSAMIVMTKVTAQCLFDAKLPEDIYWEILRSQLHLSQLPRKQTIKRMEGMDSSGHVCTLDYYIAKCRETHAFFVECGWNEYAALIERLLSKLTNPIHIVTPKYGALASSRLGKLLKTDKDNVVCIHDPSELYVFSTKRTN